MNRRLVAACLIVSFGVTACSPSPDGPRAAPKDPSTKKCPEGLVDSIGAWGDAGFSGTVTLLHRDASCVVSAGLRDPETAERMSGRTVFAIGSVSKSFTAAAVMQLIDEGKLSLDATAGSLVAELSGPAADATVEQLLTHTSGIEGNAGPDHEPLSRKAAIAKISALPRAFTPGKDFGYTNGGYTLLALIVDTVTGDYRTYLAEHTLRPVSSRGDAGFWDGEPAATGPRAVGYPDGKRSMVMGEFNGPHWATSGNGDLAMSTPTLAAWTAGLFRGESLSAGVVDAIKKPRWDHGDGTAETYGWVAFDKKAFGTTAFASAGGGGDTGHNVITAYVPASDTAIAIASSTSGVNAEQLMQAIIPALVSGDPVPEPAGAEGTRPDHKTIDQIEGTYTLEDGDKLVVEGVGDVVSIQALGDSAIDALFSFPADVATTDVAAHEAGVVELLTGDIEAGQDERDLLGKSIGGIEDVQIQGTVFRGNELRTYVTVVGGKKTLEAWYALNDQGGVGAAEAPTKPPALKFGQQRRSTLISSDPTGRRKDVRVSVDDHQILTVDNGTTVVTARPSK